MTERTWSLAGGREIDDNRLRLAVAAALLLLALCIGGVFLAGISGMDIAYPRVTLAIDVLYGSIILPLAVIQCYAAGRTGMLRVLPLLAVDVAGWLPYRLGILLAYYAGGWLRQLLLELVRW